MSLTPELEIQQRVEQINFFVKNYLENLNLSPVAPVQELKTSMLYSAMNGGKRFRPVLTILVGELLGAPTKTLLPFATAVEMVHTYSLIHDDLPCMDNDDFRRGQPTNHKVYGEDFALLAGDALLTEAFSLIAHSYEATLALELIKLLSDAAGIRGMVGGQAIDLRPGKEAFRLEELTHLHLLKTGALIRVAAEGAGVIAKAPQDKIQFLKEFGESLGLAFQVADDVLDHGEKGQDQRSFTGIVGLSRTKELLAEISQKAQGALKKLGARTELLDYLVHFNLNRQV